jgi:hypothetical protein
VIAFCRMAIFGTQVVNGISRVHMERFAGWRRLPGDVSGGKD